MKFEQAFYTRGTDMMHETGEGLGIASSSSQEQDFLKGCKRVGAKFAKEWSNKTAQFVIYSDEFKTFVGVGVSPELSGEGGNVNKICHIFVPCEEERKASLCNPDMYYLGYPFQRELKKREQLEQIELSTVLCKEDYLRILEKYHLDQKRLAYFLYKIYPIMFKEENFVWILVDSQEWEEDEYPVIAREITWLASCLAPGVGEKGIDYRKRLTYSVNAEDNTAIVHIAYSDNNKMGDIHEKICLGKEPEVEIPKLYLRLAEKAVESLPNYQNFISSIMCSKIENIKSEKLKENFFKWKLREGEKICKRDLPYSLDVLIEKAKSNPSFQETILKYIPQAEDLEAEELRRLLKEVVIQKLPDCRERERSLELTELAGILIFRLYEKSLRLYQRTIAELPKTVQESLVQYLFFKEDSCIRRHFEKIETFEEFWDAAKLYSCINENKKYIEYIRNLNFAKDIPELIRSNVLSCAGNSAQNDGLLGTQKFVWEMCQKDISSGIFCTWAFENQEVNIWRKIKLGDVEEYEKIKSVIQNKPYLREIEEVQLEDERAELNRVCYCLWKQIVEQKECDLQVLENFELSIVREDMQNFLDNLEKILIKRADDKDYIVYLMLEVKLDAVCFENSERTPSKRYAIYDKLKTEEPRFYAGLLKAKCDKESLEVKEKLEEIKDVSNSFGKEKKNQINRMVKDMGTGGSESGILSIVNNLQRKVNENSDKTAEMEKRLAGMENEKGEMLKSLAGIENEIKEMKEMLKGLAVVEDYMITILELVGNKSQHLKSQGIGESPELPQPNRLPDYQDAKGDIRVEKTPVYPMNSEWLK